MNKLTRQMDSPKI